MVAPKEIRISFYSAEGSVHQREENILITALGGTGKILNKEISQEQMDELISNLEDAFSFLAEDGDVDISVTIESN